MKYYFFLDETGDHGLSFVDENFPVFVLCGCLVSSRTLENLEKQMNRLKIDFFGSTEVILHSREIRKCEGAFQCLFDLDLKAKFYERLNHLISSTDFKIIGAGVNKKKHIQKYGRGAADPYALSLSFILERLIYCLDSREQKAQVGILVEKRGKKEDRLLLAHYNSVIDSGTYFVSSSRFKSQITDFKFCAKRVNINGLQLADLTAYPLARYVINPKEPYIPFLIVKGKLYCDNRGKFDGWGLKVFP